MGRDRGICEKNASPISVNQSLCIIIPTLREHENLTRLIPEIFRHVPDAAVLVCDDHSEDGTKELAARNVHILDRKTHPGYGKAILDGFCWVLERGYDRVVTMDADFSHDPKEIPALVAKLGNHDVVIGSRYIRGGAIANWKWHRRLLSRFANSYVRSILGLSLHDATTGFGAYNRRAVQCIADAKPSSEGYAFLVECKYLLQRAGCTFAEHPIVFRDRREGTSKMSWRVIWESIWLPWKLKYGKMKQ